MNDLEALIIKTLPKQSEKLYRLAESAKEYSDIGKLKKAQDIIIKADKKGLFLDTHSLIKMIIECDMKKDKSPLYYASKLYGHDMVNIFGGIYGVADEALSRNKEKREIDNGYAHLFYFMAAAFKALTDTSAFIASGDKNFINQIPIETVKGIISLKTDSEIKNTSKSRMNDDQFLSNLDYAILRQFMENAPTNYVVRLEQNSTHRVLSVQDFGTGIQKKHLDKIFRGYSTTRGGYGLELAKLLSKAQGGYIQVITTNRKNSFVYDTDSESIRNLKFRLEKGSTFVLRTPQM